MFSSISQNISISKTCTEFVLHLFNGQEKDDEWNGTVGAEYDYGARIYDARICKFLSIDPSIKRFSWLSPYQFSDNTPIQAIDLEGLEAWTVKNTWNKDFYAQFSTELHANISKMEAAGKVFTCDDLALETIISFSKDHNLPFKWTTGIGEFDAEDPNYKDYNTFLNDVKEHSGASDFANTSNTNPIEEENLGVGDIAVLQEEGNTVPNHIQLITGVTRDSKTCKILSINIHQGNFNGLGRYLGSDDPTSLRYLGVPIQSGTYTMGTDTYINSTKGTTTTNFLQSHYSLQLRQYNYEYFNKKYVYQAATRTEYGIRIGTIPSMIKYVIHFFKKVGETPRYTNDTKTK